MHVLERQVLIARALGGEDDRRLVSHRPLHVPVVKRIAAKESVPVGKAVIDPALSEILVGRLGPRKEVLCDPASLDWTVRQREQETEVLRNQRVQFQGSDDAPVLVRDNTVARVLVRHVGDPGHPKAFLDGLERAEEERLVAANRAAKGPAELVALEGRDGRRCGIEEVLRIQCRIAQVLKQVAVKLIRPGACNRVDDAADRAQHLEFLHRLHA